MSAVGGASVGLIAAARRRVSRLQEASLDQGGMERPDGDGKSRRRRRRRKRRPCSGKGQVESSSLIGDSAERWEAPASSGEDGDNSSVSSPEHQEDGDALGLRPPRVCSTPPAPAKRRREEGGARREGGGAWRPRRTHPGCGRSAWVVTQKNALVHLNELRPGLRYEVTSRGGPLHAPVFSVGVEVDGLLFEGRGPTVRRAKLRAAERALRSFVQFPNSSQALAAVGDLATFTDFSADWEGGPGGLGLPLAAPPGPPSPAAPPGPPSPAVLLNELLPGLRYACLVDRGPRGPPGSFVMAVRVGGRVFEGCGRSKRAAKARAAAAALDSIYSIGRGPEEKTPGLHGNRSRHQLPQVFADAIFRVLRQKFAELTDGGASSHRGFLSGIVMTTGLDLSSAQVVALATGTRCLDGGGGGVDRAGALSDCHAEVISRRALLRFLYAQLELLLCDRSSIFAARAGGGFRLRDGVLFHMFVRSSPCGDARLNCPYESRTARGSRQPSRKLQGHLRVKVDGGEGTLPSSANQKAPGGAPPSMSCTDKLAKWSAVGLQGALLSHLMEPVYLHSLTVGTLTHTGHLSRALSRRLAPGRPRAPPYRPRAPPYRRRRLLLGHLSSSEARPAGRPPSISTNWSCGDGGLEEVNTSTGRRTGARGPSRLCRRALFARWLRLQQQMNAAGAAQASYSGWKAAAGRYQRAVQSFIGALQEGGLGTWIRKPPELGDFHSTQD